MTQPPSQDTAPVIRILQSATDEDRLVRAADPAASVEEIRAGTSGCVNHLCGCSN